MSFTDKELQRLVVPSAFAFLISSWHPGLAVTYGILAGREADQGPAFLLGFTAFVVLLALVSWCWHTLDRRGSAVPPLTSGLVVAGLMTFGVQVLCYFATMIY